MRSGETMQLRVFIMWSLYLGSVIVYNVVEIEEAFATISARPALRGNQELDVLSESHMFRRILRFDGVC